MRYEFLICMLNRQVREISNQIMRVESYQEFISCALRNVQEVKFNFQSARWMNPADRDNERVCCLTAAVITFGVHECVFFFQMYVCLVFLLLAMNYFLMLITVMSTDGIILKIIIGYNHILISII